MNDEIEAHFFYYALFQIKAPELMQKHKLNTDECTSAIYYKFIQEGRPVKKGYNEFQNLLIKVVIFIIKNKSNRR